MIKNAHRNSPVNPCGTGICSIFFLFEHIYYCTNLDTTPQLVSYYHPCTFLLQPMHAEDGPRNGITANYDRCSPHNFSNIDDLPSPSEMLVLP